MSVSLCTNYRVAVCLNLCERREGRAVGGVLLHVAHDQRKSLARRFQGELLGGADFDETGGKGRLVGKTDRGALPPGVVGEVGPEGEGQALYHDRAAEVDGQRRVFPAVDAPALKGPRPVARAGEVAVYGVPRREHRLPPGLRVGLGVGKEARVAVGVQRVEGEVPPRPGFLRPGQARPQEVQAPGETLGRVSLQPFPEGDVQAVLPPEPAHDRRDAVFNLKDDKSRAVRPYSDGIPFRVSHPVHEARLLLPRALRLHPPIRADDLYD